MSDLNIQIFQFFNELTRYSLIEQLAPLIADLPIFFLPLFLVSMWFYYSFSHYYGKKERKEFKEDLMFIFYSCVVVIIFSYLIKSQVHFARPETAITEAGKLLLSKIPESSFPSDHASVSVAFLTSLFFAEYKKVFWFFLPWVILMLLARIISGVHWPLDIGAGIILGIFAAMIVFFGLKKLKLVKNVNSFIMKILSYIKL